MTRPRRRNHQLTCEALETRQLLSAYYIINESSGKVLDDPDFSTKNGAQIIQYQLNGGANQQWNLVRLKDGNDEIINESSGKVLDDPDFSKSNGATIIQYQHNNGLNQQWSFEPGSNGFGEIVNASSGKVLDDPESSTSNGAQIIQYQPDGGANQSWMLLPAGNGPSVTNYVVNASSGKVLDDAESSTSDGTPVIQYQLNGGGANQRWVFVPLAGGHDLIVNAYSGDVLEDPNFSNSNGTTIVQNQINGGLNQQWNIVSLANGNDDVSNAYSGKLLEDPDFSTNSGTQIDQWQANAGANQQWSISPLANPVASTAYSPAPASAKLFNNNKPSYLNVEQGALADCWLVASLAEVAARDPQDIENMFTYDGTTVDHGATARLYTVRFYSTSGAPVYVQVDTKLPSGGEYYDSVDNDLGTQALWVALAEKAYAVANGLGYVTTNNEYQDSYAALNYGNPAWALHAITGQPASDYSIDPANIATAWDAGNLVVICTSTPQSSYIVGNHCYAVVGYDSSSGEPFEVFNPWGTDSSTPTGWAPGGYEQIYGLFLADAAFISQNFYNQSIATRPINLNHLADPATQSDGYATSGTIPFTQHSPSVAATETSTVVDDTSGLAHDLALASILAESHSPSDFYAVRVEGR